MVQNSAQYYPIMRKRETSAKGLYLIAIIIICIAIGIGVVMIIHKVTKCNRNKSTSSPKNSVEKYDKDEHLPFTWIPEAIKNNNYGNNVPAKQHTNVSVGGNTQINTVMSKRPRFSTCCTQAITAAKGVQSTSTDHPEKEAMKVMNAARKANNVGEFTWDPNLASQATTYANHLAQTSNFEHGYIDNKGNAHPLYAAQNGNPPAAGYTGTFGQNLAMGYGSDANIAFLTQSWIGECTDCNKNNYCQKSTTSKEVGHYTQALWRGSTQVGCGTGTNDGKTYLVCNFNPPGNMMNVGEFKENVPIVECSV